MKLGHFDDLYNSYELLVCVFDHTGRITTINSAAASILTRRRAEEVIGRNIGDIIEGYDPSDTGVMQGLNMEDGVELACVIGGKCRVRLFSKSIPIFKEGRPELIVTVSEILENEELPEALQKADQKVAAVTDMQVIENGAVRPAKWVTSILNLDLTFIYASPGYKNLLKTEPEKLVGHHWEEGLHPDEAPQLLKHMEYLVENGEPYRAEYRKKTMLGDWMLVQAQGEPVFDASGYVRYILLYGGSAAYESKRRMEWIPYSDFLTGLPNRRYLSLVMQNMIDDGDAFTLIMFDCDHFSWINDYLGSEMGDVVLQNIANRMKALKEPGDLVFRTSGDEFILLKKGIYSDEVLNQAIDEMLKDLDRPWRYHEQEFKLTFSVSAVKYPQDGETSAELLKHLKLTLNYAKENGKNNIKIYEEEIVKPFIEATQIGHLLPQSILNNELHLVYQPIYDLETGQFTQAEALLRWNSGSIGQVSPGRFIPVAENNGMIGQLTDWVINTACRKIVELRNSGLDQFRISINLSSVYLENVEIRSKFKDMLERWPWLPRHIEFEITESQLMEKIDQSVDQLHQLRALGFAIALDDFGVGVSSLSYLKRLPIDKLKIDRSLIQNINEDFVNHAIVESLSNLAAKLGIKIVAEGVEQEQELLCLQEMAIHFIQGFYFSKPVGCEEISGFLLPVG